MGHDGLTPPRPVYLIFQNIAKCDIIFILSERGRDFIGQLIAYGLFLIIAVAVTVISTIIGLFIGNIILFESIGLAIAAGCLSAHFLPIHPAFCLLIGISVFIGLRFLMNTKIGFWVIGGCMSLLWGLLVAVFVYDGTGKDMIWTYVSWGLVTLVILALHLKAKSRVA